MATKTKLMMLAVLAFCTFSAAQNKRFIYEHSFAEDSTNIGNVRKDIMVLDVDKDGSKYYAKAITEEDSLKQINKINPGRYMYQGIQNFDVVAKIYTTSEYHFYTRLLALDYLIIFKKKLNWIIEKETKKINGFHVQKAVATLYNRKWIAWFTQEILIQDGPYLFHGLPGLIVKIEDENETHIFELAEIQNLKNNNDNSSHIPYYFDRRLVIINEKKWQKLLTDFWEHPFASDYSNNTSNTTYHLEDGTVVSKAEFFRISETKIKETRKKSNNLLRFEFIR